MNFANLNLKKQYESRKAIKYVHSLLERWPKLPQDTVDLSRNQKEII